MKLLPFDSAPAVLPDARTRWLSERRSFLGASEVAAVLGEDPYAGPLAVFARKVAGIEAEETSLMRRGRRLEPVIAAEYADVTGREVIEPPPYEVIRHQDLPWLGCTLDRRTRGSEQMPAPAEGDAPLELKLVGRAHADEWREGRAPLGHQLQLQIQIACTGAAWGSLCGLVGLDSDGPEVRDFPRHDRALAAVLPRLEAFWRCVERREPPPADGLAGTSEAIRILWADEDGSTVDLDEEVLGVVERWERAKATRNGSDREADLLGNELRRRMGSASFARLPDGSLLELPVIPRAGYTVAPTTYRKLRRFWPRIKGTRR